MGYYCLNCRQVVSPIQGNFRHPHLGIQPGQICFKCGLPVMYYDGDIPPVGARLKPDSPVSHTGGENFIPKGWEW
jgi:hypothetical protein